MVCINRFKSILFVVVVFVQRSSLRGVVRLRLEYMKAQKGGEEHYVQVEQSSTQTSSIRTDSHL